mmetsp:Transcript_1828/g.6905  ORF Transcript_1828/g.6905 Transcript_1828/m.6905 type:complete len:227 (-) Transcript_1828:64-744(-)
MYRCSAIEQTNLMFLESIPSSMHRLSASSNISTRISGERMGGRGIDTSSKAKRIFGFSFFRKRVRIFSRNGGWPIGLSSACSTIARMVFGSEGALARIPGYATRVFVGSSSILMDSPNCIKTSSPGLVKYVVGGYMWRARVSSGSTDAASREAAPRVRVEDTNRDAGTPALRKRGNDVSDARRPDATTTETHRRGVILVFDARRSAVGLEPYARRAGVAIAKTIAA